MNRQRENNGRFKKKENANTNAHNKDGGRNSSKFKQMVHYILENKLVDSIKKEKDDYA